VRVILAHLLMLEFSPSTDPRRGWRAEIAAARADIADRLTETLRRDLQRRLPRLHSQACDLAALKMEEYGEAAELPKACPYTLARVLEHGWYPERHLTLER
jgi:hypothetical protein